MNIRRTYLLILVFVLSGIFRGEICAQTYHTRSGRALKAYNDGKRAWEFRDFVTAEKRLKEAVASDEGFFEAYVLMGEMFYDLRRFEEAATNFRRAVEIDSVFYEMAYYYLGKSEFNSGNYAESLRTFKKFISTGVGSQTVRADAMKTIANSAFAIEAVNNPVSFNPINLGDSINTGLNEYSPSITADGNTLMFTRELDSGANEYFTGRRHEDFYLSYRNEKGEWSKAVNAGSPLNTQGNEGAQSIGAGGQYMYFTACERPEGLGRCDIYFSSWDGIRWSEPANIGKPVNTIYWESQPSISADGKTLFFVSSRPGGYGGTDIWIAKMDEDGKWGEPINAGDVLNTAGDETTPFIHFDGKTLYFASNGRPNMGGFDIYMSRLTADGEWDTPVNIGYPINTHNDEMGLVIESNGYRAYYASTATRGRQKDLFWFELHEEVRPEKVSYLKGKVFDYDTRRSIRARYELTNLSTGEQIASSFTTSAGQFLVCLPSGFNYGLNVSADGYLFYSENFPFEGDYSEYKPLVKDIPLNLIASGEKIVLYNILFNVNSSELLRPSYVELEKLYRMLSDNPGVRVEIGGHTDDTGSDDLNIRLSEARAKSVVKYLVQKGIEASRLSHRGYGKGQPVQDNSSAEGRRLNRRTEVMITEIIK